MQNIKFILVGLFLIVLTACSESNPALSVDPDTLAKAINNFESDNMGIDRPSVCGEYYANPDKTKQNAFINVNDSTFQTTCQHYAKRLALYLNQNPDFKGISANNLMSQATWQHYFQSKFAQGSD